MVATPHRTGMLSVVSVDRVVTDRSQRLLSPYNELYNQLKKTYANKSHSTVRFYLLIYFSVIKNATYFVGLDFIQTGRVNPSLISGSLEAILSCVGV